MYSSEEGECNIVLLINHHIITSSSLSRAHQKAATQQENTEQTKGRRNDIANGIIYNIDSCLRSTV